MISVIIVEPNNLVRQKMRQILKGALPEAACEDIDYTRLFSPPNGQAEYDLMLLAVPDTLDKANEILEATKRSYRPTYILLLSETGVVNYSMHDLPITPAGHLSKHSSPAILASAVSLILAGGQCFPPPSSTDRQRAQANGAASAIDSPRRRWYDRPTAPPAEPDKLPGKLTGNTPATDTVSTDGGASGSTSPPGQQQHQDSRAQRDCELLGLTRRQYEILVLLTKGHTVKSISRVLDISSSTVKTHTDSLYRRLAVHNRNAAVFEAVSRGAHLGLDKPAAK